jgi:pilus assembly protein CpaF
VEQAAALDRLAGALRERLLAEAGVEGDLDGRIRALVEREAAVLDAESREALVARVAERSFGLGPLEPLLRDASVDEVMVNGAGLVWVERGGRLEATDVRFGSAGELRDVIERILAPLGRRVDEAEPLCDARLPDHRCASVVGLCFRSHPKPPASSVLVLLLLLLLDRLVFPSQLLRPGCRRSR